MAEQTNPDVKLAFDTIKAKRPLYDELYKYYSGHHPLRYSTEKLRKVFQSIKAYFSENWLAVVIDAVLDRLILKGFDISKNAKAKEVVETLWRDFNIAILAEDVHESSTITGEAFAIAMKVLSEETDNEELDIYYNDPRMCHVFYMQDQPNKKRMGAKLWQDEEGYTCLTLYYTDRYEYYKSNKPLAQGKLITSAKDFVPDPDLPEEKNEYGVIPVFHWRTSTTTNKRDLGPSEISMQDAINKLLSDMMVSSEFNSYIQRVIISKADPGNLPNEPGANWWLPSGDDGQGTSVQELGGRALDPYVNGIDKLATSLAIISRTPKHYFFGQGGDPSGEALIALEAPLNKKVKKRQGRYGLEWKNFIQYLVKLSDNLELDKSFISPVWEPAETVQPRTNAEISQLDTSAGMPLITSKRRQGWSDSEIEQLQSDMQEAQKTKSSLAQDALDQLRTQDNQNNTPLDQQMTDAMKKLASNNSQA